MVGIMFMMMVYTKYGVNYSSSSIPNVTLFSGDNTTNLKRHPKVHHSETEVTL